MQSLVSFTKLLKTLLKMESDTSKFVSVPFFTFAMVFLFLKSWKPLAKAKQWPNSTYQSPFALSVPNLFILISSPLVCGMRQMDPEISHKLAEIAWRYKHKGVVGFDLAGPEDGFSSQKHAVNLPFSSFSHLIVCFRSHSWQMSSLHFTFRRSRWLGISPSTFPNIFPLLF